MDFFRSLNSCSASAICFSRTLIAAEASTPDGGSRRPPAFGEPGFGLGVVRPSTARSSMTNRSLMFDPARSDGRSTQARRFRDVANEMLALVDPPSVQHKLMARRIAGLVVGLEDIDSRMAAGETFSNKELYLYGCPRRLNDANAPERDDRQGNSSLDRRLRRKERYFGAGVMASPIARSSIARNSFGPRK